MTTWRLQVPNAKTGGFLYDQLMAYDDSRFMYDSPSGSGYTVFWKLKTAN